MTTLTMRVPDQDGALIKAYARFRGLTVSDFARQAMLERIEDESDLQSLREAIAQDDGTRYSMDQVARELGL